MSHDHSRREFLQRAVLGTTALTVGAGALGTSGALGAPGAAVSPDAGALPALPADRVFEGELISFRPGLAVLGTTGGERALPLSDRLSVWRGGETGTDGLAPGQDLLVRLDETGAVERLWSDLTRASGTVVEVRGEDYGVQRRDGSTVPVRIPRAIASVGVHRGQTIDLIGVRLEEGMLTTVLLGAHTADSLAVKPKPDDVGVQDFVYTGHATWFSCSTGAGRCGTCNTGSSRQLAWPALDTCGACSFTCCDCSRTCVRQVHLSCGRRRIDVRDTGNNRLAQDLVIVDCGPNQNALCSGSCGRRVVDLTRPTFARFRDPSVGCFPCRARVNT